MWIENHEALRIPFYGHSYEAGELPDKSEPVAFCVELPGQIKSDHHTNKQWEHRLLAICNVEMRQKQLINLEQRCEQAIIQIQERFIVKRGRKRITTQEQAQDIVQQVLHQCNAQGLIEVQLIAPNEPKGTYSVSCALNTQAYQQAQKRAG